MAQTITGITQTKILSILDTYNHTAATANMYMVKVDVTETPPSGLIITIQQNSSTVVSTTTAPASTQQLVSLQTVINCAASDVISVILSSSSAADKALNNIRGTLNIHVGST